MYCWVRIRFQSFCNKNYTTQSARGLYFILYCNLMKLMIPLHLFAISFSKYSLQKMIRPQSNFLIKCFPLLNFKVVQTIFSARIYKKLIFNPNVLKHLKFYCQLLSSNQTQNFGKLLLLFHRFSRISMTKHSVSFHKKPFYSLFEKRRQRDHQRCQPQDQK